MKMTLQYHPGRDTLLYMAFWTLMMAALILNIRYTNGARRGD